MTINSNKFNNDKKSSKSYLLRNGSVIDVLKKKFLRMIFLLKIRLLKK